MHSGRYKQGFQIKLLLPLSSTDGIIVLNVHAPSEETSDDSKDSFYEELEQVFL